MQKAILTLFATVFAIGCFAQKPISVSYKDAKEIDFQMLTTLMDFGSINAEIKGIVKGREAIITQYVVKGTEVDTNSMPLYTSINDSSIMVKAISIMVSDENCILLISINNASNYLREIDIKDDHHILMETEVEITTDPEIPIFAYTSGIKTTRNYDGEPISSIDYCGLRNSKVHPREWQEKFGITNYIYYTIRFE